MSSRLKYMLLWGLVCCGIAMCFSTEWLAYRTNGGFGFPLDDPWIHLQFARNLHDFGAFSYYKNEMVTSGSTSPLYTMLLAACFFVSHNEFIISYVLGVGALCIGAVVFFKLSLSLFEESIPFACAAVVLLLFEPRLEWVALSGMETTLFILLLLASFYCYRTRRRILLGLAGGLLIWTRPEAVLFYLVLFIDAAYAHYIVRSEPDKKKKKSKALDSPSFAWAKLPLLMIAGFGLAYVLFNVLLSGSVLPNTYAAKVRYYSGAVTDFPPQVFHYVVDGHLTILAFFIAAGMASVCFRIFRRKPTNDLVPLLWSVGLFLTYWNRLPFLYQEGRYLMPILPFVILLGLSGIRTALELGKRVSAALRRPRMNSALMAVILCVVAVQFVVAAWNMRPDYAQYCKYINDRQMRTANWIHDNLPERSVIATHDIGAIAYYSGRKIVDMVGLVSPEMINNIGRLDKLKQFLMQSKVTHVAVLRNWFEVVNQNAIYQTDEQTPEIMEVFPFDPAHTYFTPREAGYLADEAGYYLDMGNIQQARSFLEKSLRIDPYSSKTHFLLGNALLSAGRLDDAGTEFNRATQLHPSYWDAELALAQLSARRNKPQEAVAQLEALVQENPSYAPAYGALARMYKSFNLDSVKAEQYLRQYNELLRGTAK